MLNADLIGLADPRWRAWLAGMPHDFYHLPEYARFAASHHEAGEPCAFIADEGGRRVFIPLIVRTIPLDITDGERLLDAASPRGYPGPLFAAPGTTGDDDFLRRSLDRFAAMLRERGIVSAFVRLHPLFPIPQLAIHSRGELVDHGDTVAIDLSLSTEDLWRQTRGNHRRHINRAKRLGHTLRIDDDWDQFDAFLCAYAQSMDRLGARPAWRLSRDYFYDLRQNLGHRVHLCVAEDAGQLAAAAVLIEEDGLVEYHLAGTMDRYLDVSPSKSIVDFARRWARERGARIFHLAGSLSRGDSLNQFKIGFSPLRYPVLTWRLVTDEAAYATLSGTWRRGSGMTDDPADAYFPVYRRPTGRPVSDMSCTR